MKALVTILLAVALAGCAASGDGCPRHAAHETRGTASVDRPAELAAQAPATRPTETDRLPPSSFEEYLSGLQRDGLMNQQNVDDVLLARTRFLKQLDRIPPEFSGYGASTVEGKLYTTTDEDVGVVLTWLDQNNPRGRLGFFTWVSAEGVHPWEKGTERLPAIGLEPYLSRRQREGGMDQRQVDDVLLARRKFMEQLDRIPPDFSGWAVSTIDGKLHTTTESQAKVWEWLDQNNPPGRFGFFTWVSKSRSVGNLRGETSTQPRLHAGHAGMVSRGGAYAALGGSAPSTSRSTPTNK